jgi:hypothetical protein
MKSRSKANTLTIAQIRAAYTLHIAGGLSLRELGRRVHAAGFYASPASATNCISEQFKLEGWPARSRIDATIAASLVHGKARRGRIDRAHRREVRIANGEILDVRCEAVRTQYPRKGQRCKRAALRGERYCISHHPGRRAEVVAIVAAARSRRNGKR